MNPSPTPAASPACAVCSKPFVRYVSLDQMVCGVRCAGKMPVLARKAAKAADKAQRERLKPRSKWMAEAQQAFNGWIRIRDAHRGCISCGTRDGKVNAGHFLSTGARPELRFNEQNVHRQCERCNTYLSGNLIPYRSGLIDRIGIRAVESLEGPHPPSKHTIDELRAIRDLYRTRVKAAGKNYTEDGGQTWTAL